MTGRIQIIDDDQFLTQSLARLLVGQGNQVSWAHTVEEGRAMIDQQPPDLLILDLSLPDGDGLALCRHLRDRYSFPIMMLTSSGDSIDKVVGLEAGADDYLAKPFDVHELTARIKAILRRNNQYGLGRASGNQIIRFGEFALNQDSRTVEVGGMPVPLTQTEYDLLLYFVNRPGLALERDKIFQAVWGFNSEFASNSLDVLVYRLRAKLKQAGIDDALTTIRGFGFKFQPPS
ncbi:MAG: response regulator transcription factor [Chthonomonas sp.]|nr:response regulator transcription factor [Chthonomonas sp.]